MSVYIIPPIYGEDYNSQWGKPDYKGKIVLDIGGSNGDTSSFFISRGAVVSVSVDNNVNLVNQCRNFTREHRLPILPVLYDMNSPEAWKTLISLVLPDVVKSDVEGAEVHLSSIPDEVFSKVPEYIVETHGHHILQSIKDKALSNGYKVVDSNEWTPGIVILYISRI